jgi:hypothetical protein
MRNSLPSQTLLSNPVVRPHFASAGSHYPGAMTQTDADKFLNQAEECLQQAESSTRDKEEWLRLAEEWMKLARTAKERGR